MYHVFEIRLVVFFFFIKSVYKNCLTHVGQHLTESQIVRTNLIVLSTIEFASLLPSNATVETLATLIEFKRIEFFRIFVESCL